MGWKIALVLVVMAFAFGDAIAIAWAANINGAVLLASCIGFGLLSAFLLVSIFLMEKR